jgi:hypothetical protein
MRYLFILFVLISQCSLAQEWRVSAGWQQVRTNLVRTDLPPIYDANRASPRAGVQLGVERDFGHWTAGTRFAVAGMSYQVRRYISDILELTGTYQPTYYDFSGEWRLGRKLWQSRNQNWQLTANLGFSVHKAEQTGHENSTWWVINQDFGWKRTDFLPPLEQKGWYQALDAGIEGKIAIGRRSFIGVMANYQYALSRLPTASYRIDVSFRRLNTTEVLRSEIRDELTPRVNRLVLQVNYFYRLGQKAKTE